MVKVSFVPDPSFGYVYSMQSMTDSLYDQPIDLIYSLIINCKTENLLKALINPLCRGGLSNNIHLGLADTKAYISDTFENAEEELEIDRFRLFIVIKKWYEYHLQAAQEIIIYREGEFFDVQKNFSIVPTLHISEPALHDSQKVVFYRTKSGYYLPDTAPIEEVDIWVLYELLQYQNSPPGLRKPVKIEDENSFWNQFKNMRMDSNKVKLRPFSHMGAALDLLELEKTHLRELINTWDDLVAKDAREITIRRNGEQFEITGTF